MTYLLQVQTKDLGLKLITECVSTTIEGLQFLATNMVKRNPAVKGMTYRIFSYTKETTGLSSKCLKTGIISK